MNSLIYLIRHVWKQWFFIFIGTIGLVSALLTIFPLKNSSFVLNVGIFFTCLFISIIITLIVYKIKHIPDDDIWLLETQNEKPTIAFPYQKNYLKAANALARSHYGKNAIGHDIVKKWYEKNPLILTVLTDSHNKFVGYFDILPLNSDFGKDFVNGLVKENEIRHYDILEPSKMQQTEYLYFAGVSVKDQFTHLGRKHGSILIYSALVYLEKFYDLTNGKKIYALAASDCGKKILEKLKFNIEVDESNRKDKLDLYSRKITSDDINAYRAKMTFCDELVDTSAYKNSLSRK
jgi:hypothetical protein